MLHLNSGLWVIVYTIALRSLGHSRCEVCSVLWLPMALERRKGILFIFIFKKIFN